MGGGSESDERTKRAGKCMHLEVPKKFPGAEKTAQEAISSRTPEICK